MQGLHKATERCRLEQRLSTRSSTNSSFPEMHYNFLHKHSRMWGSRRGTKDADTKHMCQRRIGPNSNGKAELGRGRVQRLAIESIHLPTLRVAASPHSSHSTFFQCPHRCQQRWCRVGTLTLRRLHPDTQAYSMIRTPGTYSTSQRQTSNRTCS